MVICAITHFFYKQKIVNGCSYQITMSKIIYEREECIGCQSCVLLEPELWGVSVDNKSNLKGYENLVGKLELKISVEKAKDMEEVVIACPVEFIKIKECL